MCPPTSPITFINIFKMCNNPSVSLYTCQTPGSSILQVIFMEVVSLGIIGQIITTCRFEILIVYCRTCGKIMIFSTSNCEVTCFVIIGRWQCKSFLTDLCVVCETDWLKYTLHNSNMKNPRKSGRITPKSDYRERELAEAHSVTKRFRWAIIGVPWLYCHYRPFKRLWKFIISSKNTPFSWVCFL